MSGVMFWAAVIYVAMCVFDLAVLAGAVWLIAERGWSAWWMALAALFCAGSTPKYFVATVLKTDAKEMP